MAESPLFPTLTVSGKSNNNETPVGKIAAVTVTVALAPSSTSVWLRLSTIACVESLSRSLSVADVTENPSAVPETVRGLIL